MEKNGIPTKRLWRLTVSFCSVSQGCKVKLHYCGTLLDGTKFDSSFDRNDPFEFSLGKGSVIKAFDMGIATMKKGEKCILTCGPEYAYGASGSPPNIPPHATLKFELEMLGWKGEDISPKGDDGIERYVIKAGEKKKTPNDGAHVSIHMAGKYENRVFDERDIEFNIGEGSEVGVIAGVELALEKFHQNETSRLIIQPEYAFGAEGHKQFEVPPNAVVEYEVTLKEFEKEPESWKLDKEQSLVQAKIFKEKGTNYFKASKFSLALKMYEKSQSFMSNCSMDEEEAKQVMLAIHLNKALCYQKLFNFDQAKDAVRTQIIFLRFIFYSFDFFQCTEALRLDPNIVKALYRRGQCDLSLGDFEKALDDFANVRLLEPENKAAINQETICKQKIKEYKEKQKKIYAHMFSKFATTDKQVSGEQ